MSSANEFKTIDDFLKYKDREGGGGKRLKNWKDAGQVTIWLHTQQLPVVVHLHNLPELVVRQSKENPQVQLKNIWGREHVCWEDEKILKKQRFRLADGRREHPPRSCGVCRTIEFIREMIDTRRISDTDIAFKFFGSDKLEENKILHAGGCTSYWKRDLEPADTARLSAAGVNVREVFKQSMLAKLQYLFALLNNDTVSDGLQIAVQPQSVGEKVRKVINDELASKAGDLGNPTIHPYAIQLLYDKTIPTFDKYSARRMDKFPMTDAIAAVIRGEKPDMSKYTKPFNAKAVRTTLEAACQFQLPWDQLFPEAPPGEAAPPQPSVPAPVAYSLPATAAPQPAAEALGEPCECGAPMTATQTKCGKCGTEYAITPDAPAATAAPAAAPAPAAAAATPAANIPAVTPDDGAIYSDEDVPF